MKLAILGDDPYQDVDIFFAPIFLYSFIFDHPCINLKLLIHSVIDQFDDLQLVQVAGNVDRHFHAVV